MLKVGLCVSTKNGTPYVNGHNAAIYNQYIENIESADKNMILAMKINQRTEQPHMHIILYCSSMSRNYNYRNRNKMEFKINLKKSVNSKI